MKRSIIVSFAIVVGIIFSSCSNQNVAVVTTLNKNKIVMPGVEVPSVYRTKIDWQERYQVPEYGKNLELSVSDAKAIIDKNQELAAKCKTGTFIGKRDDDVVSWKGIPYAKAPIGKLRFMRSELPDNSDKYFEAYYFGKTAIQAEDMGEKASLYLQGEDCLNLNVWTSKP